MVSSATPRALAPSARHTLMFNFFAASKSMLSRPLPLRLITRRNWADSKTFAVTGSTPANKPTQSGNNCVSSPSVGNLPAGDRTTVYPACSSFDNDAWPLCVTDLGVTSIFFVLVLYSTQSTSVLLVYEYCAFFFCVCFIEGKKSPLSDTSGDSRQLIKYGARSRDLNMKNVGDHARPSMKKINPPILNFQFSRWLLCTSLL